MTESVGISWHRGSPRAPRVLGRLLVIAATLTSSCTILSDFDVEQCDVDADCEVPIGALRHCADGRCVEGCRDNRHCASIDPRYPICSVAAGECLPLTSAGQECYITSDYDDADMGGETAETLISVAAFAPSIRSSTWLTLELAANELRQAGWAGPTRALGPLLIMLCNDGADAIDGAMAHLRRFPVSGIIASFDDGVQPEALAGTGGRTFLLSPGGRLGDAPTPFYWYLGGDHRPLVPVFEALLAQLAPQLEQRAAAAGHAPKVAVVLGPGEDEDLAQLVTRGLVLGGLARAQLVADDRLRSIPLAEDRRERSIAELIGFAPDLVLLFARGTFGTAPRQERAEVVGQLEAALAGTTQRPLYVVGPRDPADVYLDGLAAADASFRARALLVDIDVPGRALLQGLRERFDQAYPNPRPSSRERPSPRIYDALYYLAYAAAARASHPRTAESLLTGLARITDAEAPGVEVGSGEGLALALQLLSAGAPVNLQGTTGSGPFDTERQLRSAPPVITCWAEDGTLSILAAPGGNGPVPTASPAPCASEVVVGPLD